MLKSTANPSMANAKKQLIQSISGGNISNPKPLFEELIGIQTL